MKSYRRYLKFPRRIDSRCKSSKRTLRCYQGSSEAKEKEDKKAPGINPELTPLDTALDELIERERECAKNLEVENKKTKEDQELARSIRQETVETFAETRARKLDKNEDDRGPNARKKSRSSGSETLAYLEEKIEKETKLKEQKLELRKKN